MPKEKPKSERVAVFLTPEQLAWLKGKKNVSETVRALLTEAMNLDRLKQSVADARRPAAPRAARQSKERSRKGGSTRR